tara:strand:+ start:1179 stop:1406 length:228 start_codon:yes stop_codon:yes gene_type:complete
VGCLTREERRKEYDLRTGLNQLFYQLHQRIHARRAIFWCEAIRNAFFSVGENGTCEGTIELLALKRLGGKMRTIR